ncbi:MYND-type zinc finger-containing chromatin reader ZMYND8-like isoform X2 [Sitodiplosis mosellana]|uniref:MYND-type zinc finger-containing chromatin reader ZMYND8-like isoform X2 n=1 Tax=Sitodiplosis mosellana TaxID=263140 RepID=UPI002444471A|nr:MYND-type zinc finger-containing chromatin reader ZMYND8-like isoform X2 [Sitodiplosis mosellana]XP_055310504.1 MYND-type zinc finger-containing chromatin reader ZMYND8-like isoform X2 [Sitodiplosis mosellana]XP_055310512.1 MYND-type zinc finger-containing chromatin reader ZMYND8-like isoform X2 [Sitodiplosis mosellana]XP_055310522.1 MYND-type zinc finger-containing chromatin reader ZMYND8-like isoform X2 [Sitodiplosis mosellana]
MSQDMETESILEMPSDIDEIEKAKAIESIVLETSADDLSCRDDYEEMDILVGADGRANVTNSLYDADESLKSTDIGNGSESTDVKEKDLDGENSTSESFIVSKSQENPIIRGNSVVTKCTIHPTSSSSSPPPTQSNVNQIVYVKLLQPRSSVISSVQPLIVSTTSQSPPKTYSNSSHRSKLEKSAERPELKKLSPIKMPAEEPTTSNISGSVTPPKPQIGHTVNLLNNNRILIKSVKNNHATSPVSMPATVVKTNAANEGFEFSPQPVQQQGDAKQTMVNETSEIAMQNVTNVTAATTTTTNEHEIDQLNVNETKCTIETSNNGNFDRDDSELEIKKEQILNENSSTNEDIVDDTKLSDTYQIKIKREFEQLQKTVNESKVLSEFVIDHNKRNRRPTKSGKSKHNKYNKSSLSDMTTLVDEKVPVAQFNPSASPSSTSVRSASKESDRSITSSFSAGKRNTRSMNTDFSAKQKQFLKGIQQVTRGTDDETDNNSGADDDDDDVDYFAEQQPNISERRKSTMANKQSFGFESKASDIRIGWDKYCWRCHQTDTKMLCSSCVRSYHANCLKMKLLSPAEMAKWQCPECVEIKAAEKENKKKKFDVKHFNKLLKYAMNRLLQDPNLQQFQFPVNKTQNPGYGDVIVNPINLSKIENNIDNLVYTNSEAFLSDIKWILHNCSIYFSDNYKVTRAAKSLQKVSKQEVGDIETCPECYLNANTMTDNWFTETCVKPHLILWAKLKGFPYWPAKAMSINSTLVDVRFFGEHDRANIPAKDCYLYSREDPNPPTNKYKRNTIADCVKEVDVYIQNIEAKYGSFKYSELKTPFNPQLADQHLLDMIPGLRSARGGRRRSSSARPDLTLKIVKTADNHLSVVKKDQTAKELPQIKRTVDITGDGAVSRTPTPPLAVLSRRKTSDTRIKRSKSTNRHSDGKPPVLDHKSYQVLRRKSMAVEKLDQKRVNAIHSNLDLNSSTESPEVSFVRYNPDSTNEKNETDQLIANAVAVVKKSIKSAAKKRKLSVDEKASDAGETPEKNLKLEEPKATTSTHDERSEDIFETNILSSVGLMKRTTPPNPTTIKSPEKPTVSGKNGSANAKPVQNKNSTCDTDEKMNEGAARTRSDTVQRVGSKDDGSPLVLVPFVEVKKEPEMENDVSNPGEQTPSASLTPICLISSNENTPAKNYANTDDNLSNIKTETSSDDDSLMIIEEDLPNSTNTPVKKSTMGIDQLLENIRLRGSISVKDINKMTLQNQQQQARKTFPKGPTTNASASILKPRNNLALNKSAPTNMVCIPLDGIPRLELSYNSTQPPPLSVVGSVNSVSLLTQNQSSTITNNAPSSTSTSNLTNGPPPLSIPAVSQPSLLNPNSINTISNGMITEQMASAVTDQIIRRNPPKLSSRPAAPLRAECDSVFPTEAGSVCKTLMENAHKMTDFFRSVIEDTLGDLANMSNPEAKIRLLELEMEKQKNAHAKEITDVKANTDRLLNEMKKSMEKERTRVINDTRKQCEMERIRSVEEAKKKQWCANCLKEAQFYCCWNTSYCNHICQRKHWEQHMATCAQVETTQNVQNSRKPAGKNASKPDIRVQLQASQHPKLHVSIQKDNLNTVNNRAVTAASVANNSGVPALRNILPKNVITSISPSRHFNQGTQSLTKQSPNQSCIIVGRSLPNWAGASSKSASLLHSNTIFLPATSQPYATITNVQSGSSAGVSLLNTSHAQGQKSNQTETIIIP